MRKKNNLLSFGTTLLVGLVLFLSLGIPEIQNQKKANKLFATWKSGLESNNVVEIISTDANQQDAILELINEDGIVTESLNLTIKPFENQQIILDKLRSFKKNSEGLISLISKSKSIGGRVTTISTNPNVSNQSNNSLRESLNGQSDLLFNYKNPYQNISIKNKLTVTNLDSETRGYTIEVKSQIGELINKKQINIDSLTSFELDIGSLVPNFQESGFVTISSKVPLSNYLTTLSREGYDKSSSALKFNSSYDGFTPRENQIFLPIKKYISKKEGELHSWVEIANTSPLTQNIMLELYDNNGQLIDKGSAVLKSYSLLQYDSISALKTSSLGMLKITCEKAPCIAINVNNYQLHGNTSSIITLQKLPFNNNELVGIPWNSFLHNDHYVTLSNPFDSSIRSSLKIFGLQGKVAQREIYLPPLATQIVSIGELTSLKALSNYGVIAIENNLVGEIFNVTRDKKSNSITAVSSSNNIQSIPSKLPIRYNSDSKESKPTSVSSKSSASESGLTTSRSYDIKLNSKDISSLRSSRDLFYTKSQTTPVTLNFSTKDHSMALEIIPHEIRANHFTQTKDSSSNYNVEKIRVSFFKMKNENRDFNARLTFIDDQKTPELYGRIQYQGEVYELKHHLMDITGKTVKYTKINNLPKALEQNLNCKNKSRAPLGRLGNIDLHLNKNMSSGNLKTSSSIESDYFQSNTARVIEIATEADYEYYLSYSKSVDRANAYILDIINQSEAAYKNYLNISFKVVHQNVWTTPTQPYTSTNNINRLNEFTNYWEKNKRKEINYDFASYFAGVVLDGDHPGATHASGMCSTAAYSLSAFVSFSSQASYKPFDLYAFPHGLGHSLGASHDNCSTCGYIMDGTRPGTAIFSDASQNAIRADFSKNICLTYLGKNTAPVFEQVPAQNVSVGQSVQFTVNATDKENDPITLSTDNITFGGNFQNKTFSWNNITKNHAGRTYLVRFHAKDSKGETSTMPVMIKVGQNSPPKFTPIGIRTLLINKPFTLTVEANNAENELITYSASNIPPGAHFDINSRVFSWTPNSSDIGTKVVRFSATNKSGLSAFEEATLKIVNKKSPWQNPNNPYDVNNDNKITPTDALLVINRMNLKGNGPLTGEPNFANGDAYIDPNGDISISPSDALMIINYLNDTRK